MNAVHYKQLINLVPVFCLELDQYNKHLVSSCRTQLSTSTVDTGGLVQKPVLLSMHRETRVYKSTFSGMHLFLPH